MSGVDYYSDWVIIYGITRGGGATIGEAGNNLRKPSCQNANSSQEHLSQDPGMTGLTEIVDFED